MSFLSGKKNGRSLLTVGIAALAVVLAAAVGIVLLLDRSKGGENISDLEEKLQARKEALCMEFETAGAAFSLQDGLYSSESVSAGTVKGELLVTADRFAADMKKDVSQSLTTAEYKIPAVQDGDRLMLEFTAAVNRDEPLTLTVEYGGQEVQLTLTRTPKKFYLPFVGSVLADRITFTHGINEKSPYKVTFGGMTLVKYDAEVPVGLLRSGEFSGESWQTVTLAAEDALFSATALQVRGDRVYAVYEGELTVYSLQGTQLRQLGRLTGLGNVRDLCLTADGRAAVVTARTSGAYIVDLSDETRPRLAAQYDTLELCTGLDIYGNYAFICSRYFGVEIVDISDLSNPRYLTRVQAATASEYQDCCVEDGILCVGIYANKRVDLYDVRDLGKIRLLSQIETDGCAQGVALRDGILYAATGREARINACENAFEYGYGTGSGLEVYDVSDLTAPVHLATCKIEGRSSAIPSDVWKVTVSGNYAFVGQLCSGAYIYDISDPARPVRVSTVSITAQKDSELYREPDLENEVYPYRADLESHGCVVKVVPMDGVLLLVAPELGVYALEGDWQAQPAKAETVAIGGTPKEVTAEAPKGYQTEFYRPGSSVWAVAQLEDGNLVLACGTGGLQIVSPELELLETVETQWSVKDIRVRGEYVFTAESEGGIAVYRYADGTLKKLSSAVDGALDSSYTSLEVTPDGELALVQVGYTRYRLVDCSKKNALRITGTLSHQTVGALYYRNVCVGTPGGKYLGISGRKGIAWFTKGEDGIEVVEDTTGYTGSEYIGMTASGDQAILISTNGYRNYNPAEGVISKNHAMDAEFFKGKCAAYDNRLYVVREFEGRLSITDITNPETPALQLTWDTDLVLDVPYASGDTVWIPCRYDGLLKLTRAN